MAHFVTRDRVHCLLQGLEKTAPPRSLLLSLEHRTSKTLGKNLEPLESALPQNVQRPPHPLQENTSALAEIQELKFKPL